MVTKLALYALGAAFVAVTVYNTLAGAFEAVRHMLAPTGFFG